MVAKLLVAVVVGSHRPGAPAQLLVSDSLEGLVARLRSSIDDARRRNWSGVGPYVSVRVHELEDLLKCVDPVPNSLEPTDDELRRIHNEAAEAAMVAAGFGHYDAYGGVWPEGLRAVWQAGYTTGRSE